MKKHIAKKGFTLIELIIVMGVLAMLVTMVTLSLTGKRERARDARRQSDLKTIQTALEQYYALCGSVYPTPASGSVPPIIFCPAPTAAFLNPVPNDPRTTTPYPMSGTATSYTVNVIYEKITPTGYANNQQ